jgi:hypothetical protein
MRRRDFIALVGGSAVAWPLALRSQQSGQMRRIGVLMPLARDNSEAQARIIEFLLGLQKLGWAIGLSDPILGIARHRGIHHSWMARAASSPRNFEARRGAPSIPPVTPAAKTWLPSTTTRSSTGIATEPRQQVKRRPIAARGVTSLLKITHCSKSSDLHM